MRHPFTINQLFYMNYNMKYKTRKPRKTRKTRKTRKYKTRKFGGIGEGDIELQRVPNTRPEYLSERYEMGSEDNESRIVNINYIKGQSDYLQAVCSDSGICVTFGKEIDKIKKFFGNFNLMYVKDPIIRIGKGNNGFVHEIKFTKNDYSSYAILKSMIQRRSVIGQSVRIPENLMYEYKVGQFLNKMSKLYPCFLETYNLYSYKDEVLHQTAETNVSLTPDEFRNCLQPQEYNLNEACKNPYLMCILIQHLKGAITLGDLISMKDNTLNYDILTLLYQIYYVLNAMKDIFTHYDLHSGNVLLYRPSPTKYIHYHYHNGSEITSFKSVYLVKIIDYGRCYFNDVDGISSSDIKRDLCDAKNTECNTSMLEKCGKDKGFSWLHDAEEDAMVTEQEVRRMLRGQPQNVIDAAIAEAVDETKADTFYIDSSVLNNSHDLRLANIVLEESFGLNLTPVVSGTLSDLYYKLIYQDPYGTPEKKVCPNEICDVHTMFNELDRVSKLAGLDQMFDTYYPGLTKLGDMHIYNDGTTLTFNEI